ncbi:hypothetical protein HPHPH11_0102 [Helicobacter pylori Hp H-11]|uniref:Uncharacterized protein n=2 Tax=Helicobacter pylori TaxID=210 RepID=N4T769_HELPX|nr:hypothetical protein HPCPY6271_1345 [Helicobacter pylori CPY6271]EJB53491.1 hypothetical protein HPHPH27_0104 [Helicobacter pylori Hp H-27]EJB87483.1 hypothetical protein HPHPH11_0102 [Helicobacter pylori Hp H-11]EJC09043.1 hypothetical protein HPHPP15_0109 [Helicobacter pylori Hp P-15]EJC11010.1 hypothetical protein HPHPP23_1529 [Helicobacter pylori Hp P-23]EJC17350.1 hypothetical protein HPHPP74_0107 [Helicobacter pylori Hp P-74]EJC34017.1 hypothetical protein HPHPP15B_0112 [Helicobacter
MNNQHIRINRIHLKSFIHGKIKEFLIYYKRILLSSIPLLWEF